MRCGAVLVGVVCGAGAGRERARFLKFLRMRGAFKFCGCGAGADKKFQPAQNFITYAFVGPTYFVQFSSLLVFSLQLGHHLTLIVYHFRRSNKRHKNVFLPCPIKEVVAGHQLYRFIYMYIACSIPLFN